jgi:hypothetical protein
MKARQAVVRLALWAAGTASLALLAGCSAATFSAYVPGPAATVAQYLSYLKAGADQSAWQMMAGTIQASSPGLEANPTGNGYVASLAWKNYAAFTRQAEKDLRQFFTDVTPHSEVTGETASVVLEDRRNHALAAGFRLSRVDNTWFIKEILVTVPQP